MQDAMGLAIISMIVSYGSIHLTDIVNAQTGTYLGVIPMWGIFIQPLAAIIFVAFYAGYTSIRCIIYLAIA